MEYVLRTFSLVKTYKDVNVVDNVSMNIPRGQIYGFVGRNGAGKTTLMRLVCGLINKSGGSFTLFGRGGMKTETSAVPAAAWGRWSNRPPSSAR